MISNEDHRLLRLAAVTKCFGALRAVDGVSLDVRRASITGLIGPNGAGKTTLFNTIAGVHAPDAGTIALDGSEIAGLRPDQVFARGLGRTFQIPRPLSSLTVLDNMLLAPRGQIGERFWNAWWRRAAVRSQEAEQQAKAQQLLDFVGLAPLAHEPARVLSGGQQKLLELARLLMVDPALILLDEPTAGVNPVLIEELIARVRELNRRGVSFLLIEHNMDVVMRLCDPVVVMAQGKVIAQGAPELVRNDARVIDVYLGEQP